MIIQRDYGSSSDRPIRLRILPFEGHSQYNWSMFYPMAAGTPPDLAFGSRSVGILDVELDPKEWESSTTDGRIHKILCLTADHLGFSRPAPLGDFAHSSTLARLLVGEDVGVEVRSWLHEDRSLLWGVFLAPKHAGNFALDISDWDAPTDEMLITYLLLVGTNKVRIDGTPRWGDDDMLDFLSSLGNPVLGRVSNVVFGHLGRWRFRESLEYLMSTSGRIVWDSGWMMGGISQETHPMLSSVMLATGTPITNKYGSWGLDNIHLTDDLIRGLLAVPRGTDGYTSFCHRAGSILHNPDLKQKVGTILTKGLSLMQTDLVSFGLASSVLLGPDRSSVCKALREAFDIRANSRRRHNRLEYKKINYVLRTVLHRSDAPKEALGRFVEAVTEIDEKILDRYQEDRASRNPGDFGPPLYVAEGTLRALFRKPVRMCMLGHWLSDAGISVDTTQVLGEMPIFVKMRLANPKYPDGLEYWINQMARDHDNLEKKEKEEKIENA